MMQFYGALILFMTLSAAYGLSCYSCLGKNCAETMVCPPLTDRCAIVEANGVITRSCMSSMVCVDQIKCCETDLCNSAIPTGSSAFLLLVSSAIITVFL